MKKRQKKVVRLLTWSFLPHRIAALSLSKWPGDPDCGSAIIRAQFALPRQMMGGGEGFPVNRISAFLVALSATN